MAILLALEPPTTRFCLSRLSPAWGSSHCLPSGSQPAPGSYSFHLQQLSRTPKVPDTQCFPTPAGAQAPFPSPGCPSSSEVHASPREPAFQPLCRVTTQITALARLLTSWARGPPRSPPTPHRSWHHTPQRLPISSNILRPQTPFHTKAFHSRCLQNLNLPNPGHVHAPQHANLSPGRRWQQAEHGEASSMETGKNNDGNATQTNKKKNPRALKPQLNAAVLLFSFISHIFKGTQVSPGQARALEESSQHVQTRLFNAPLVIPT